LTWWTIPAERTKNGRAHEVPVSSAAVEILRGLPQMNGSEFVFSVSGALPISGYSGAKAKLDTQAGVQGWRFHDLRRTAATRMAAIGIAPHVVEKVLNHVPSSIGGVAAIYNRHSYLDERRHALEAWAQYVRGLGLEVGNVTPLRG
jgi:integrase